MIKRTLFMLAAIAVSSYCNAQVKKKAPQKKVVAAQPALMLRSQTDSTSYAFGLSFANDLKSRGISNLNYQLLTKAMDDVFKGGKTTLTPEQCQKTIMGYLSAANKKKFAASIAEGDKFLQTNRSKQGVTTTASGLQYEVLQAGTGANPKATDEVTVHYKGTLLNGKQFDSSYDRKEPATFPLNRVIAGWTEGVQQMSVGSKYRFFIPYHLAYGERGAGQDIPPYSTLIFEVELIKIGK